VTVPLLRWEGPGPYVVAFSTRRGGVSDGPYASLNLGRLTGDDADRVAENRQILCREVGADEAQLNYNRQVHGAKVLRAERNQSGRQADALWTDVPGRPLLAFAADCLPIVLSRAAGPRPALAVVHAGWRGLLAGVIANAGRALGSAFAAVIGPGIGPCCYEVGGEVAAPFGESFGWDVARNGKLDLWTSAQRALNAAGAVRVERTDLCTSCLPELFFSHRRDRGTTGRQGVIAYVA
jgi:YfiH family protein